MNNARPPLSHDEVVKAIEHKSPPRVPMMLHFWNNPDGFEDRADAVREIQAQYPHDVHVAGTWMPQMWDDPTNNGTIPGYSWLNVPPPTQGASHGLDANVGIADWAQLDDILAAWPNPNLPQLFPTSPADIQKKADGRYIVATWWFCFYERLWSMRGMENLLMDFYLDPEPVERLMDALVDFYSVIIRRSAKELGARGIFTSDDIGMQTGPMFSRDIFLKFFKPRYAKLIQIAHDCGMHFWLHTCGDVRLFLDDFIEIGLDVIHPIQKYTMDEREVAKRFGGRICFWTGMDVQQILPRGTPEDVRREVRFMIDTFDRREGGCMVTAGNGVTPDVPVENLRAFYDEAYNYGVVHRKKFDK